MQFVEWELLREVTIVDDSRSLGDSLFQQRMCQEADVVGPGHEHAVGDGEIDRLPQSGDGGSKIAAMCLPLAAPQQHERDVEDVPTLASLRDRLVEDGVRFVEQPRTGVARSRRNRRRLSRSP